MDHSTTTILEAERLIVRGWRLEDAEDAFLLHNDPEATRYLAGDAFDETIDATRERMTRRVALQAEMAPLGIWAVEERASGRVIGHALLAKAQINGAERVELGYGFVRTAWGKGYATELSHALLRHGFDALGLDEVYGVVMPENGASRRVLEKIGMRNLGMGDYNGYPIEVLMIEQ